MSTVANLILDLGGCAPIATGDNLDRLSDMAIGHVARTAAQMNTTIGDCLDNLDLFAEQDPAPGGVRDQLADNELGCWRSTVRVAATLATQANLEAQVEDDLTIIRATLDAAEDAGFEPVAISTTCALASIPHASEIDLPGGTLYTWTGPHGTRRNMLKVLLADECPVWIELVVRADAAPTIGRPPMLSRLTLLPSELVGTQA